MSSTRPRVALITLLVLGTACEKTDLADGRPDAGRAAPSGAPACAHPSPGAPRDVGVVSLPDNQSRLADAAWTGAGWIAAFDHWCLRCIPQTGVRTLEWQEGSTNLVDTILGSSSGESQRTPRVIGNGATTPLAWIQTLAGEETVMVSRSPSEGSATVSAIPPGLSALALASDGHRAAVLLGLEHPTLFFLDEAGLVSGSGPATVESGTLLPGRPLSGAAGRFAVISRRTGCGGDLCVALDERGPEPPRERLRVPSDITAAAVAHDPVTGQVFVATGGRQIRLLDGEGETVEVAAPLVPPTEIDLAVLSSPGAAPTFLVAWATNGASMVPFAVVQGRQVRFFRIENLPGGPKRLRAVATPGAFGLFVGDWGGAVGGPAPVPATRFIRIACD